MSVLHVDADAFFASVEQRDDPTLRGKPVIVGRGVVMAASYEARAYGVKGGMGGAAARRLCPDAIVVPARFEAYVEASRALFDVFESAADVVEPASIEEAFLQVEGGAADVAAWIRTTAREAIGLPVTVGVGSSKVVAKVASRRAKPEGLFVVAPEEELAFLHGLPVQDLWGIGPATARKLTARRLTTVGEVARLSEPELVGVVGRGAAPNVYAMAHNRDLKPVRPRGPRRSFGAQRAFSRGGKSTEALDNDLIAVIDRVMARMQAAGRIGRTIVLRLRFGDFTRATRSRSLPAPTAKAEPIIVEARQLLAEALPTIERRGLTLIGITVTNLDDEETGQLALAL